MNYIHTFILLLLVGAASAQQTTVICYKIDGIRVEPSPKWEPSSKDKERWAWIRSKNEESVSYTLTKHVNDYSVNTLAGTIAGVNSRNGEVPNIRGARQEGTAYFVDGMRVLFTEDPVLNQEQKSVKQTF